jgi:hypothetical protein
MNSKEKTVPRTETGYSQSSPGTLLHAAFRIAAGASYTITGIFTSHILTLWVRCPHNYRTCFPCLKISLRQLWVHCTHNPAKVRRIFFTTCPTRISKNLLRLKIL